MRYSSDRSFRRQFEFLRRQFLQEGELPFADVLSGDTAQQALDTIEVAWNERIEPRLRKRRFKKYDYMTKPRNEIKLQLLK